MLTEVGGHQSADELVSALRKAGYPHARTTVYNALQDLARAGLVREAPVAAGALRYEADTAPHHHFVCRNCGLIINVPIDPGAQVPPPPHIAGAEVTSVDVVYRGVCRNCAEAGSGGRSIDLTDAADVREHLHPRPADSRAGSAVSGAVAPSVGLGTSGPDPWAAAPREARA